MALTSSALIDDLATLLGLVGSIDVRKAELVLDLALQRASSVVTPVPDLARPIVLDVAARGYTNPQGVATETAGPFGRTFRAPGVYLTKRERIDLRLMTGSGGAFTVNPINPAEFA